MKVKRLGLGLLGSSLVLAGCGSAPVASHPKNEPYYGQTITVDFSYPSPPKSMLKQFTKQTGITVKWVDTGFGPLQTKIASSMEANTYFADVTDVDWSKVGEYNRLHWFVPLNKYFNVHSLSKDVPQLSSFMMHGTLVGMPADSSFFVTTINTHDFKKAGIATIPTTMSQYTSDLKLLQTKKIAKHPLDIPFAAAEGLTGYWFQTTAAFGGAVLGNHGQPLFTGSSSPGYKALRWMVAAYRSGLVPSANVSMLPLQAMSQEMAQNSVASVLADFSGNVGSIYNVPSSSSVVNNVKYIPVPGVKGPAKSLGNPDGLGIPVTAKHKGAAAVFIKWFTSSKNQAIWSGLKGTSEEIPTFPTPMRVSSFKTLVNANRLPGGNRLLYLLQHKVSPMFPYGAPPWYAQFSATVSSNIHAVVAGSETIHQAIQAMGAKARQLNSGS